LRQAGSGLRLGQTLEPDSVLAQVVARHHHLPPAGDCIRNVAATE
jgi:hypothetical protein